MTGAQGSATEPARAERPPGALPPPTPPAPREGPGTGAARAVVAVAVILVLGLTGAGFYAQQRAADRDAALAAAALTTTPAPEAPAPADDPAKQQADASTAARQTLTRYQELRDAVGRAGGATVGDLSAVSAGIALIGDRALARRYEDEDLHQEGTVEVVRVDVSSVTVGTDAGQVPEVVLKACEDSTDAFAVDEDDDPVRAEDAPTQFEWLYTLRQYPERGGLNGWFVVDAVNQAVTSC